MSKTYDFLVYVRNRDMEGLGEWLVGLLDACRTDLTRARRGRPYDGELLVPLLQMADEEVSKALLSNQAVRNAMQAEGVEHDEWISNFAKKDTGAWIWALQQGWGQLFEPRPSVLKNQTITTVRAAMEKYPFDPKWAKHVKPDLAATKAAWDAWLRLASNRNPWLIGELYTPQYKDLLQLAHCKQKFELPKYFWKNLESVYPGAMAMRSNEQATYAAVGVPYQREQERAVIGRIIGLAPAAEDSIPMEFEPEH